MREGALRAPGGTMPQAKGRDLTQKGAGECAEVHRSPCGEAEQAGGRVSGPHRGQPVRC